MNTSQKLIKKIINNFAQTIITYNENTGNITIEYEIGETTKSTIKTENEEIYNLFDEKIELYEIYPEIIVYGDLNKIIEYKDGKIHAITSYIKTNLTTDETTEEITEHVLNKENNITPLATKTNAILHKAKNIIANRRTEQECSVLNNEIEIRNTILDYTTNPTEILPHNIFKIIELAIEENGQQLSKLKQIYKKEIKLMIEYKKEGEDKFTEKTREMEKIGELQNENK